MKRNSIVGKKILFIRTVFDNGGRSVKDHQEYTGTILDKIFDYERIAGKMKKQNFYLVELDNGIIEKFHPCEANRILPTDNNKFLDH